MQYLGPWEFDVAQNAWRPPLWSSRGIDLRDNEGRHNLGLFFTDQEVSDSSYIEVNNEISRQDAVRFISHIGLDSSGITGPISLSTLFSLVYYYRSDDDNFSILTPSRDGSVSFGEWRQQVKITDNPRLLDRLRKQYTNLKNRHDGTEIHRKWLTVQAAKYRIPLSDVSLITLDSETPLPPSTAISDTLTGGGNNVALNTGPWEYPASHVYRYYTAGAGLASAVGGRPAAAHTTLFSSDDMWAQIEWVVNSIGSAGPAVRIGDPTVTANCDNYHTQRFGGQIYISKVINNSITNLTNTSQAYAVGDIDKIEIDGSALKAYVNGTQKLSTTDTSLSGQLQAGFLLVGAYAAGAMKNFSAEDMLAFVIPKFVHHYRQQGIA